MAYPELQELVKALLATDMAAKHALVDAIVKLLALCGRGYSRATCVPVPRARARTRPSLHLLRAADPRRRAQRRGRWPGMIPGLRRLGTWEAQIAKLAAEVGQPELWPEDAKDGFHALPVANKVPGQRAPESSAVRARVSPRWRP